MPSTQSHHRSRSSIDRLDDLLAGLEPTELALLLDDLNHTTAGNVPVSEAIELFEPPSLIGNRKSMRKSFRNSSTPINNARAAELVRRHSKRISSAPERPVSRARAASPIPAYLPPSPPSEPVSTVPSLGRPRLPSLSLSPLSLPEEFECAIAAVEEEPQDRFDTEFDTGFKPRSYKRVSRPMGLTLTEKAELHQLLMAYLYDTPPSSDSSSTPSPTTPDASTHLNGFSSFSSARPEPEIAGLDILEPSPLRSPPPSIFGRGVVKQTDSIFGVLSTF